MGTLYIVSTPIGNLKDITLRALEILKLVDIVACEDTRTSGVLLKEHSIKAEQLISLNDNNEQRKLLNLITKLEHGANIALISDAGTPLISDPGYKLVKRAIKQGIKVIPIPGPSAGIAAASISGFPMDRFLFLGFPPAKKKRKRFFEELSRQLAELKCPVIFYESPYRILKTLNELNSLYTKYNIQNTDIVVCRELTKKFETIYRGKIEKVIKEIEKDKIKGEFVVIVEGKH